MVEAPIHTFSGITSGAYEYNPKESGIIDPQNMHVWPSGFEPHEVSKFPIDKREITKNLHALRHDMQYGVLPSIDVFSGDDSSPGAVAVLIAPGTRLVIDQNKKGYICKTEISGGQTKISHMDEDITNIFAQTIRENFRSIQDTLVRDFNALTSDEQDMYAKNKKANSFYEGTSTVLSILGSNTLGPDTLTQLKTVSQQNAYVDTPEMPIVVADQPLFPREYRRGDVPISSLHKKYNDYGHALTETLGSIGLTEQLFPEKQEERREERSKRRQAFLTAALKLPKEWQDEEEGGMFVDLAQVIPRESVIHDESEMQNPPLRKNLDIRKADTPAGTLFMITYESQDTETKIDEKKYYIACIERDRVDIIGATVRKGIVQENMENIKIRLEQFIQFTKGTLMDLTFVKSDTTYANFFNRYNSFKKFPTQQVDIAALHTVGGLQSAA